MRAGYLSILVTIAMGAHAAPDLLADPRGALSRAAPGRAGAAIARDFVAAHRTDYGLDTSDLDDLAVVGESPGGRTRLRLVRLEQRIDGVPVFGSETRVVLDRDGRVWRAIGRPVAHARAARVASGVPLIDADSALRALLDGAAAIGPVSSWRVWYATPAHELVDAWAIVASTAEHDWYAVVDARDGSVLWRRELRESASTQPARFDVYVQADGKTPADSPAPQSPSPAQPGAGSQYPAIARTTVSMLAVEDPAASPNGWIDDCPGGADGCDTTRGNNVDACLDRDATPNVCDAAALDVSGRPRGNPDSAMRNRDFLGAAPRDFTYTPPPSGGNPDAGDTPTNADSQRGAATQAFYVANWYHDRLFALGFDEPSGNFQQSNFQGNGGLAGDRILADVQNAGANDSNFVPAPDGVPGRMQLLLFTGATPNRDADLEAFIEVHELTHGMTHRLVGNATGLLWDVPRSMGEGWSDFFALALLNTTNADAPDGRYPWASWTTYKLSGLLDNYVYGFRRFPYTTDNAVNPLTLADADPVTRDESGGIAPSPLNVGAIGALEVHNAGSIWASALWEVRARIIADPAGANGDVPSGNETMLQLVVDALKMTPSNPSFAEARDAILAADCATNACANERSIWAGFADRGFGYGAAAPLATTGRFALGHMSFGPSAAMPHLDVVAPRTSVIVDDAAPGGNGNGVPDPGETVKLRIPLTNPWHAASALATGVSATLTSATAGVAVGDGVAAYPAIGPQATADAGADTYTVTLASNLACGAPLDFDLATSSSLGPATARFTLRVGTAGAAGAPVTYTKNANLAIPDNVVDGVSSTLVVADDLEIADLNFRVDSLTHPATGQITVLLRAPNGYGVDLIWRRGGLLVPNQGLGANLVNVTIDDDLPIDAAHDLNQTQASQAPFTGSWLPAYNSPFWDGYATSPMVPRDPVPELARLDGASTKGAWTVQVADGNPSFTGGTLDAWSIIVQPRVYACTVFVPGDALFEDGFE